MRLLVRGCAFSVWLDVSILIKHCLLQLSQYRIIRLWEFSYSDVLNRPTDGVGPDYAHKIAASDQSMH